MSTTLDPELERLLDAAADEISEFGFRRTSIHDIACRAGVSRPTAYRRLCSKDTLLQLLLARVAGAVWSEWQAAGDGVAAVPERASELFVAGMRTAREHPSVSRLLNEAPDLVVRVWTTSNNPQLLTVREEIARSLDPERTLSVPQAARAADFLLRIGLSFLATPSDIFDDETLPRRGCRSQGRDRRLGERHIFDGVGS